MTTHYSYEHWLKYVKDELGETERSLLEDHLYTCDQCLDIYIDAVDAEEDGLPSISNETAFMDGIMQKIAIEPSNEITKKQTKRAFYHTSIFHYAIAACFTLILMSTGFFHSIIKHTENIQKAEVTVDTINSKDGIVDRTFAWMDTLDGSKKEERNK